MTKRNEIKSLIEPKQRHTIDLDAIKYVSEIMKQLDNVWEVATLEERDKLAKMLLHRVYVNKKSVVAIEPTAILWQLLQTQPLTALREGQDSNLHRGQRILPYNYGVAKSRKLFL